MCILPIRMDVMMENVETDGVTVEEETDDLRWRQMICSDTLDPNQKFQTQSLSNFLCLHSVVKCPSITLHVVQLLYKFSHTLFSHFFFLYFVHLLWRPLRVDSTHASQTTGLND